MKLQLARPSAVAVRTGAALLMALLLAVIIGFGGGIVGWFGQIFFITLIVPVVLLASSYRFGMFAMVLLTPFAEAHFVPRLGPLSLVNILLLGVLTLVGVRLALKRMVGETLPLPVPKQYLFLYLVPITIGFLIGSTYLGDMPARFRGEDGKVGTQSYYWISTYLKGVLFSLSGLAIGVSVVEYRNARTFVILALTSAVLYVLVTAGLFILSSQTLEAAVYSRQMFSASGRHANSVGGMMLPILAAALYMRDVARSRSGRFLISTCALTLVAGVLLTGSRGAFLGMLAIVGAYVFHLRKLRTILVVSMVAASMVLVAPPAITDRLTMGVDRLLTDRSNEVATEDEQLTSGRLYLATQLLPEILESPLIGKGMGSTRWSAYAKSGGMISNPHNLYLSTLLDIGILGAACMVAFILYVTGLYRRLAVSDDVDPLLRAYFRGSYIGLVGFLVFALSAGYPYPQVDQWFLWVAFGIALGCNTLRKRGPVALPPTGAVMPMRHPRSAAGRAFWLGRRG